MGWAVFGLMFAQGLFRSMAETFQLPEKLNALARAKQQVEEEKRLKLELMDTQFQQAKEEAIKDADRSDAMSDVNEVYSAEEANNALEQLGLKQIADSYNFNYMAEQNAAQTGNELASAAASGVRGSSLQTAIDLEAAQNAQQLQLTEDQTRAKDEANLNSILNALSQNRFQIQFNRTDAYDLRHSYDEGGYNHKMYMLNRGLQENAYNNRIGDLQLQLEDYMDPTKNTLRLFRAFMGGQDANSAQNIVGAIQDFSKINYGKKTNYAFNQAKPTTYNFGSGGSFDSLKINR